jgi:O-antigen/teichoic acid export membrane protein
MGASGLGVAIAWAIVSQAIPATWWNDVRVAGLLLLTSVLVFVRVIESALVNILRAQQRSGMFSLYSVLRKYFELAVVLVALFFVLPGLVGFYTGTIVAEILAVAALGWFVVRKVAVSTRAFSPELSRAMLAFGIPLIASDLGGTLLNVGDRYVIQLMLGGEALGIYSAARNVCDYIQGILIASVGRAIVPMYVRMWEERGEAESRRFIERSLRIYIMIGAAVVAGLTAVGEEILNVLASEKYREGHRLIFFLIAGLVVEGGTSIFGAGLYVFKQTKVLMWSVVASVVANIVLNVTLMPVFGIRGAAIATLLSYSLLAMMLYRFSARRLPIAFPMRDLLKFTAIAWVMYEVVVRVAVPAPGFGLALKIVVGIAVYGALVPTVDRSMREAALVLMARLRPR